MTELLMTIKTSYVSGQDITSKNYSYYVYQPFRVQTFGLGSNLSFYFKSFTFFQSYTFILHFAIMLKKSKIQYREVPYV